MPVVREPELTEKSVWLLRTRASRTIFSAGHVGGEARDPDQMVADK
jgi:hypothetical protein